MHIPYIHDYLSPNVPLPPDVIRHISQSMNSLPAEFPDKTIVSITVHSPHKPPSLSATAHNLLMTLRNHPSISIYSDPVIILTSWQQTRQPPSISLNIMSADNITEALELIPGV